MGTPQFDMFHDLNATEVQAALGIDPASDVEWLEKQALSRTHPHIVAPVF